MRRSRKNENKIHAPDSEPKKTARRLVEEVGGKATQIKLKENRCCLLKNSDENGKNMGKGKTTVKRRGGLPKYWAYVIGLVNLRAEKENSAKDIEVSTSPGKR